MLSGAPSVCMRRKATVTSWVPEAARLSAMTAPELYLPVPRKRREENSVPAMTRVDAFIFKRVSLLDLGEVSTRFIHLALIHISEPTRLRRISYAVFCLKK